MADCFLLVFPQSQVAVEFYYFRATSVVLLRFVFFAWSPIEGGRRGNLCRGKRWQAFCSIDIPTDNRQENRQQTRKRKQTKDNKQQTGKRRQAFCPIDTPTDNGQKTDNRQQTKDKRQQTTDGKTMASILLNRYSNRQQTRNQTTKSRRKTTDKREYTRGKR